MSEKKVTLYYNGSIPGGVLGIKRAFRPGDSYTFDKRTADKLLKMRVREWFTREEYEKATGKRTKSATRKSITKNSKKEAKE